MSQAADPTRALAVFTAALEVTGAEREKFIESAASGDPELLKDLHKLLAADAQAQGFGEEQPSIQHGARVGAWRILRLLGEGGMGQVWLAARADGQFEQQVALKCMRVALPEFALRFALERSALARLEHPDIARLLDAGVEKGRPWFAMEYVNGRSLREWAVGRSLSERMRLLARVSHAVHAAHIRLVVHRDLKPGNILVTADDAPKLVDFGIAKLLDHAQGDLTRDGPQPFTPDYASPEQRRGETISTATDVYALGVIGYELAAGRRPALEREPDLPSAVCAEPWADALRGDLDQVLLRALAAAPGDRYSSATAFAEDLQHWLAGNPVSARAPSSLERLRRLVMRYRALTAAIAMTLIAILAGTTVALWQAREARAAERVAIAERDKAQAVREFLEGMLASADPRRKSREVTVAELLADAERSLDHSFVGQPGIAAEVSRTLAETWRGLGRPDAAKRNAERAVALLDFGGGSSAERGYALRELAQSQAENGELDAAAINFDRAIELSSEGASLLVRADLLNDRGVLRRQRGDLDGAQADYAAALKNYREAHADARQIGSALNNLAVLASARGDSAGATRLHRESVAILEKELPPSHPDLAGARITLASALEIEGTLDEAEALYSSAVPDFEKSLGSDHPKLIQALASHAWLALRRNDAARALELTDRAVASAERALGTEHPLRAYAFAVRGEALTRLGRYGEAVRDFGAALAARKANMPAGHWLITNTESALAYARVKGGDESARPLLQQTYQSLVDALGAEHEISKRAAERLR